RAGCRAGSLAGGTARRRHWGARPVPHPGPGRAGRIRRRGRDARAGTDWAGTDWAGTYRAGADPARFARAEFEWAEFGRARFEWAGFGRTGFGWRELGRDDDSRDQAGRRFGPGSAAVACRPGRGTRR